MDGQGPSDIYVRSNKNALLNSFDGRDFDRSTCLGRLYDLDGGFEVLVRTLGLKELRELTRKDKASALQEWVLYQTKRNVNNQHLDYETRRYFKGNEWMDLPGSVRMEGMTFKRK